MTRGGRILEICSSAAFQPLPYLNVYAATKAFLYRYSRALGRELIGHGISVTAVCPYWVKDTRFISNARETDRVGYIRSFPFATKEKFVVRQSCRMLHSVSRFRLLGLSVPCRDWDFCCQIRSRWICGIWFGGYKIKNGSSAQKDHFFIPIIYSSTVYTVDCGKLSLFLWGLRIRIFF